MHLEGHSNLLWHNPMLRYLGNRILWYPINVEPSPKMENIWQHLTKRGTYCIDTILPDNVRIIQESKPRRKGLKPSQFRFFYHFATGKAYLFPHEGDKDQPKAIPPNRYLLVSNSCQHVHFSVSVRSPNTDVQHWMSTWWLAMVTRFNHFAMGKANPSESAFIAESKQDNSCTRSLWYWAWHWYLSSSLGIISLTKCAGFKESNVTSCHRTLFFKLALLFSCV